LSMKSPLPSFSCLGRIPIGLTPIAVPTALTALVIPCSVGAGMDRRTMANRVAATVDVSVRLMMPLTVASWSRRSAYLVKRPTASAGSTPRMRNWMRRSAMTAFMSTWSADVRSVTVCRVSLGPGSADCSVHATK